MKQNASSLLKMALVNSNRAQKFLVSVRSHTETLKGKLFSWVLLCEALRPVSSNYRTFTFILQGIHEIIAIMFSI